MGFKIGPAERADQIEKLEAELAEWRQGPWVRKADHDEAVEGFSTIAKKYHAAETELGRLRAAIVMFRDAKGRYHSQCAAEKLFGMVAKNPGAGIPASKDGRFGEWHADDVGPDMDDFIQTPAIP